ncbi:MAG: hypothetical protein ABSA52_00800 [Candidatus Binatia bacterium]
MLTYGRGDYTLHPVASTKIVTVAVQITQEMTNVSVDSVNLRSFDLTDGHHPSPVLPPESQSPSSAQRIGVARAVISDFEDDDFEGDALGLLQWIAGALDKTVEICVMPRKTKRHAA